MKRPTRGTVSSNEPQVLIVDDNADAAMSLAMLLELEDIVAACVGDAEAALRFVQDTKPALLLIDIGLPGMNGYELAKALRRMPSLAGSTLIALTGREEDAASLEGTGFDQFWTKPFDPKKLLSEARRILGSDQ
jgi:CheY-like chemotaxis protein